MANDVSNDELGVSKVGGHCYVCVCERTWEQCPGVVYGVRYTKNVLSLGSLECQSMPSRCTYAGDGLVSIVALRRSQTTSVVDSGVYIAAHKRLVRRAGGREAIGGASL